MPKIQNNNNNNNNNAHETFTSKQTTIRKIQIASNGMQSSISNIYLGQLNGLKNSHTKTGTANAIFPTSSSACIIFFIRDCQQIHYVRPHGS